MMLSVLSEHPTSTQLVADVILARETTQWETVVVKMEIQGHSLQTCRNNYITKLSCLEVVVVEPGNCMKLSRF